MSPEPRSTTTMVRRVSDSSRFRLDRAGQNRSLDKPSVKAPTSPTAPSGRRADQYADFGKISAAIVRAMM
ncbi:hypothetical protein GGQ96_001707 [Sphingomonas abaci]|uniref:Uncharacterized protein n=1 Tax=Sphingomonas abaci TaxID=237611 RepID=A0A7W7AJV2_9SPHN|nr:hypothetical protein [Sphingomonas abaci]